MWTFVPKSSLFFFFLLGPHPRGWCYVKSFSEPPQEPSFSLIISAQSVRHLAFSLLQSYKLQISCCDFQEEAHSHQSKWSYDAFRCTDTCWPPQHKDLDRLHTFTCIFMNFHDKNRKRIKFIKTAVCCGKWEQKPWDFPNVLRRFSPPFPATFCWGLLRSSRVWHNNEVRLKAEEFPLSLFWSLCCY